MVGASRFEGGSWVRVGFLLTYGAFAYGCVVVGAAAVRVRHLQGSRPGRVALVASAAVVAAVAALSLPAIRFPTETLTGFEGLDLLSVLIVIALAGVVVAAGFVRAFETLRSAAAACLTGVLAGNLLIQRFTTRGTSVAYGLWWATGLAVVALIAALGVRGRYEGHR
ncbi:MAG: hypothetical protein QOI95_3705 [Acidimicrobiaceae bacterium]|jgi:hypothetical protein